MTERVISRIRNRQRAEALSARIIDNMATQGMSGRQALSFETADDIRLLCVHAGLRPGYRKRDEYIALLLSACPRYRGHVALKVEIRWGHKWNGSHYEETSGEGMYVTAMETNYVHSNDATGKVTGKRYKSLGFKGCPLGRSSSVNAAILDFLHYGAHEWQGEGPLEREMLHVVETVDYRRRCHQCQAGLRPYVDRCDKCGPCRPLKVSVDGKGIIDEVQNVEDGLPAGAVRRPDGGIDIG